MGFKILVIDNELKIATAVKTKLNYEGHEVSLAVDGITGLTTIRQSDFDLIILDCELPDLSGLEICRRLRRNANQIPIILTTTQCSTNNIIEALDVGADDCLTKPFSIEELLARIRSNLRRAKESEKNILKFANLQLDLLTRKVNQGDRIISLTATEFNLLQYLLSHPFQVISRQQLLDKVWDYGFSVNDKVVEVHIRHLRQKLEANREKRLIQTVRGIGYVLRE